jgi:hypothetical protein
MFTFDSIRGYWRDTFGAGESVEYKTVEAFAMLNTVDIAHNAHMD